MDLTHHHEIRLRDRARIDVLQDAGKARRVRLRVRDLLREPREEIPLADLRVARFQGVEEIGHG